MKIAITKPLFAWDALEDSPSLQSLRVLLESIPDQPLLASLRAARGKGRDDYPVEVLWGTLILAIALRHVSIDACLEELRRNPALRLLLGIEAEDQVPGADNMSRFLATLGEEPHLGHLRRIFDTQVSRLGAVIADFGKDTAGDSTGLSGRAATSEKLRTAEIEQGLPQPSGGRKEYKDDGGNVTKVVEWFGYKLHLLVDVKHEVALAYHITDTKAGDNQRIADLVSEARQHLPPDRIKTLAYDKAADDGAVHDFLQEEGIAPLIRNRHFKLDEPEKVLGGSTPRNIVYDQAGTVYCSDRVSPQPLRHPMAYIGHEPQRGTLKYRCPARHGGWSCPSDARCNGERKYGLTVRVKQEIDLRRFPSIPRATKRFERMYKGRTAIERVNARLKVFWGIDDGQVYGARRFHGHVGAVMVVHLAFATLLARAGRYAGSYGKMTLSPIAQALQELIGSPARRAVTSA
ncbi:MAG: transposase [Planctomycetaceae bacterium]|nr:transposase [Planctomycetaceae bacterium]